MAAKFDKNGVPFRVGQHVVWRDACAGPLYGIIVNTSEAIYDGHPHVLARVRTLNGEITNVNLYLTDQFEVVGASFG